MEKNFKHCLHSSNADKNKQYACMVFNFQIPNAKIKQQIMKIKI